MTLCAIRTRCCEFRMPESFFFVKKIQFFVPAFVPTHSETPAAGHYRFNLSRRSFIWNIRARRALTTRAHEFAKPHADECRCLYIDLFFFPTSIGCQRMRAKTWGFAKIAGLTERARTLHLPVIFCACLIRQSESIPGHHLNTINNSFFFICQRRMGETKTSNSVASQTQKFGRHRG